MKKTFPGFYHPTEEELATAWQSDTTLFVFDTNTLINLYGYATLTKDDFFLIVGEISDKIWIPYHVILEYQRRRLSIVRNEKAIFSKIGENLNKIESIFDKDLGDLELHRRLPALHKNTIKLQSDIKKLISNYKRSVSSYDKKQPCVRGHDAIREKLNSLFENKIGSIPKDQSWLNKLYEEGEERYKNKIPPGFKDDKKSKSPDNIFSYAGLSYNRKFGDLIIWKQILEKAKDDNIKSVIFVTDDAKEDWWYILNSRGDKKIGPRAELREEICNESAIDLFTIYNTADFLENGKTILNVDVSADSISDAEYIFTDKFNKSHIKHKNELMNYFNVKKDNENLIRENWEELARINKIINTEAYSDQFKKMQSMVNDPLYEKELERLKTFAESDEYSKIRNYLSHVGYLKRNDDSDNEN